MKNKLKKISMAVCACAVICSSINSSTIEANAWSWKKSKTTPYVNTKITTRYVGEADFDHLANVANKAVKNIAKNNKGIGKASLKSIFSSIFKGGKSKGFLRTYLQNNLKNAQETTNVINSMNKELKKTKSVFSNWN